MARYEAYADFQRDYYKRRKLARTVSWKQRQSQYNIDFVHELNIVLEGWLEYYTPVKKGFILQSKGAYFQKI